MTRYLDIGVVRIQKYLTRAPNLKGRRGASTMISEVSAEIRADLPDGLHRNTEAGAVDGVISTRLADDLSAKRYRALAGVLCAQMREQLPAAALRASVWNGDSYGAARARDDPEWQEEWLPAVAEWPVAKTCDWCRTWPALWAPHRPVGSTADADVQHYCRDCTRRLPAAGASTNPARVPGPEKQLAERLPGRTPPDDFAALAALGKAGDNTHLATLYADGNNVGTYMADRGYPPALAAELHEATWTSVVATVTAISGPDGPLPLIPHLVGGDDVLVSVPAHQVWPAAVALLQGFAGCFDARDAPSLSAGIVMHHRDQPLADVIDLGAALLATAKRSTPGQAALAWHSITHDGATPTPRPVVPLTVLTAKHDALAALAALPGSARQQLARLCREEPSVLDRHVERLGLTDHTAAFSDGIALEDALNMVRWWA